MVHSHLKLIYTYIQVKVTSCVCPYVPLNLHSFGGDYFIHYCGMIPKSSFSCLSELVCWCDFAIIYQVYSKYIIMIHGGSVVVSYALTPPPPLWKPGIFLEFVFGLKTIYNPWTIFNFIIISVTVIHLLF